MSNYLTDEELAAIWKAWPRQGITSARLAAEFARAAIAAYLAKHGEVVKNVVLRDGLPTLLRERDVKPTDLRLFAAPQPTPQERQDAVQKWCWYHDGDERVPVLDSEEEAHAEAQQWINDNCEPGEEHEYLVAPMKNGLQMLPSAGHIATSILESINEGLCDEMGAEEWPLDFSKDDFTALGELVLSFITTHASIQWWTVDHKNEVKHTARAAMSKEPGHE